MNTKKIGIDAISFYVPSLYLPIKELAEKRNIPFEKLNLGLGLNKMAIADKNEDTASFAANALLSLIDENKIDPKNIGRIYLGTESALDAAKPTSTYAVEAAEKKLAEKHGERCLKNCDVLDMTFACVGGVDALHNSIDWVNAGKNRQAIVIASDIAKYDLNSTGEYTQGAGAVAMLINEDPAILAISETWGIATKSEGDFFKPRRIYNKLELLKETLAEINQPTTEKDIVSFLNNTSLEFWADPNHKIELFKEEPVFDGPFSNACYQKRNEEALDHFKNQKQLNVLKDWDHLIFHLPYAYQARRMLVKNWVKWLKDNNEIEKLYNEIGAHNENQIDFNIWIKKAAKSKYYQEFIDAKLKGGEKASSEIGNMYTASIFMSLLSLLNSSLEDNVELAKNKIGFFSYGSGSKSKVFEGVIQNNWKNKILKSSLFSSLDARTKISVETYEQLHNRSLKEGHLKSNKIQLSHIETAENKKGFRVYSDIIEN